MMDFPRKQDVRKHLRKLRAILGTPERWTKGTLARDKDGNPCNVFSSKATSYCLSGALLLVRKTFFFRFPIDTHLDRLEYEAVRHLGNAMRELAGTENIVDWQDSDDTSHDDLVDILDRALELA